MSNPLRVLIDGSALTASLTAPAERATVPSGAGIIPVSGIEAVRIMAGGVGAADATINYQHILWWRAQGNDGECWVPLVVAAGAWTLSTATYGDGGVALGASFNRWADTITPTVSRAGVREVSTADNTAAWMDIATSGAEYLQVETDLGTAQNADVFFMLFDKLPSGLSAPSAADMGAVVGLYDASDTRINPAVAYAEGAVHVSCDKGSLAFGIYKETVSRTAESEGAYTTPFLDNTQQMYVQAQPHIHIVRATMVATDWTVIDDACTVGTVSANHVLGTTSLLINKVDGTAHTFGGVKQNITSVDLRPFHKNFGYFTVSIYIPEDGDFADLEYFALRLGDTTGTNYNEWRVLMADMTTAEWNTLRMPILKPAAYAGAGWDPSAVTFVSVGFNFAGEDDACAGLLVDHIAAYAGMAVNAVVGAESFTTQVTPKVDVKKLGNKAIDLGAGAVGTGTQRNTLASDDPAVASLAAMQKSVVGASGPTIDSYATVPVDCAADTDTQELVADPGDNKQIWVYGLAGTADVAGSIKLWDNAGARNAMSGDMPVGANGGIVIPPSGNFSQPWIKVTTSQALDMQTTTCAFDGLLTYAIVSV